MNEEYRTYLDSERWKSKRKQKLKQVGRKCEACGSRKKLEVHHLTYEHIFNEPLEDLMALCFFHHRAAEECVAKGLLTRVGNVRELAKRTLEVMRSYGNRKEKLKHKRRARKARLPDMNAIEAKAKRKLEHALNWGKKHTPWRFN